MLTAGSVVAKSWAQLVLKYKYNVVNEVLWLIYEGRQFSFLYVGHC